MNITLKFMGIILIIAQITLIRAEYNKMKYSRMKENEILKDIEKGNFVKARAKVEEFGGADLQDSMNYIVHKVYANNEFQLILQLLDRTWGSLLASLAIYRALNNELKNHKDFQEQLTLIKNFESNVHVEEKELGTELKNSLCNIAIEALTDAMQADNYTAISTISENIYDYRPALFNELFSQALNKVFNKIDAEKLIKFFKSCKHASHSIYGYSAVFKELQKNGRLNKPFVVDLAFALRKAVDSNIDYSAKLLANQLQNHFPKSVKHLAFAQQVCIRSVDYPNEYLYAAPDEFNKNFERRRVFTWIPGNLLHQAKWLIEPYGDVYHIKNKDFTEYMYANYSEKDAIRKSVYTWVPKGTTNNSLKFDWLFEPVGNNMYIKEAYIDEYLYASSNTEDSYRRKVFTHMRSELAIVNKGDLWTIDDCS